jgi:hypothetical protein
VADLFGEGPNLAEQIQCAERELAMRQKLYPRWVAGGRMKRDKSEKEIACMVAIIQTLKGLRDDRAL